MGVLSRILGEFSGRMGDGWTRRFWADRGGGGVRGWTAIQIREGDNLSCKLARIVDNTIVSLPHALHSHPALHIKPKPDRIAIVSGARFHGGRAQQGKNG